jgi:benzylsuccinate CoA-transferase BbsE subunit
MIDGPSGEQLSSAWVAFNTGKRGITLDLNLHADREKLKALVAGSHFILETFRPGYLDAVGLGWNDLVTVNPSLVMTSITPYGGTGPDSQIPAGDLELMASSGAAWLTGDADRPPVRISLPQAGSWTGAHAAMGTLIAHHYRQLTGRGQHVDVSAQGSLLPILVQAPNFWEMLGVNPHRAGPSLPGRTREGVAMRNVWPCRDGYLTFAIYGGPAGRHSNRELVMWMAEGGHAHPELLDIDWDRFDITSITASELHRLEAAIGPFLLSLTKREFLEQAIARRILGYVVAEPKDIANDVQLAERDVWQDVHDPTLDMVLRHPTGVFRLGDDVSRHRRPAPVVGEHNAEVLAPVHSGERPT